MYICCRFSSSNVFLQAQSIFIIYRPVGLKRASRKMFSDSVISSHYREAISCPTETFLR